MGEYTVGLRENFEKLRKIKEAEETLKKNDPERFEKSKAEFVEFMKKHIERRDSLFGRPNPSKLVKAGMT